MKESKIIAAEWEAFLDDLQQTLDGLAVPKAEPASQAASRGTNGARAVAAR
jgi:hypothetical protein